MCVYTLQGLIRNTGGDCRCVAVGLGQRQQFRFLSIVMQHAHTQLSKRGSAQIGEAFCIKETAIGNAGGGSGDTISFQIVKSFWGFRLIKSMWGPISRAHANLKSKKPGCVWLCHPANSNSLIHH